MIADTRIVSPQGSPTKHSTLRHLLRYVASICILCLIAGSLAPFRVKVAIGTTSYLHRPLHIISFGLVGLLLFILSESPLQKIKAAIFIFVLAAGLEMAEFMVTYRPPHSIFEWWDLLDDTFGIVAALLFTFVYEGWQSHRKENGPARVLPRE